MTALARIFKYLKGLKSVKMILSIDEDVALIAAYADASFLDDKETSRSSQGCIIFLFGAPISWSSKRQTLVTLSTTKAEYVCATDACKELLWVQTLLQELDCTFTTPMTLFGDNVYNWIDQEPTVLCKDSSHLNEVPIHFGKVRAKYYHACLYQYFTDDSGLFDKTTSKGVSSSLRLFIMSNIFDRLIVKGSYSMCIMHTRFSIKVIVFQIAHQEWKTSLCCMIMPMLIKVSIPKANLVSLWSLTRFF